MKILIDTNVLISAALFPLSIPYQAYIKAVYFPNHGVICEQNIDELNRIFNKKFPNKIDVLNRFLFNSLLSLEIIPIPTTELDDENKIRDLKDRPILRAALNACVDIILTGDKDFLESNIDNPKILTPAEFLNY